jgi:hypothetical protein
MHDTDRDAPETTDETRQPRERRGGNPAPDLERAVPDQPDEKRGSSRVRPDPR